MKRYIPHTATLILLAVAMYASTQANVVATLEGHMRGDVIGGMFFILMLIAAVVLAPIAALPLIPIATALFGPFFTGIYSVIGWTIGGILAFIVARYAGRPLLSRLVTLETLARYERVVPNKIAFITLVLLRMIIPVDVLSYAVGFLSTMPLRTYAAATFLGVIPFSFIFAYGSSAIVARQYFTTGALVGLAVAIFCSVLYLMRSISNRR